MEQNNCSLNQKTNILCIVAAALAVVLLTFYLSSSNKPATVKNSSSTVGDEQQNLDSQTEHDLKKPSRQLKPKPKPKPQPVCPLKVYMESTMREIFETLKIRRTMCRPEDVNNLEMHKIPKSNGAGNMSLPGKDEDIRGAVVIYVAVALLLTSLGAAFVEAYKEKVETARKPKPQLTRRCSLADLTVLRHSRRESMRSNSFMEEARSPLKLLGARPPSLLRQSSFPVIPDDSPPAASSTPGRHDLSHFKTLSLDRSGEDSPELTRHGRTIKLIRRH